MDYSRVESSLRNPFTKVDTVACVAVENYRNLTATKAL